MGRSQLPYAVVGCKRCEQLWLVDDDAGPERVECPRCGRRHCQSKLRSWKRSDSPEALEDERAALLAKRATDVDADVQTFGLDAESFAAVRDRVRDGLDALEPTALVPTDDPTTEFEQLLEARVQGHLDASAPAPIEATHTPAATDLAGTSLVDEAYRPDRDAPTRREELDDVQTGVRLLTPGDGAPLAPVQRGVTAGTRRREWLPALVEALLPTLSRALRRDVAARDPDALNEYRRPHNAGDLLEELHRAGVVATDGVWASKLLTYAVRYVDDNGEETLPASDDVLEDSTDRWRAAHERRRQQLREDLLAPGTGQGTHPAGLEELRAGFFAAFDHLVDVETVVRVRLQPDAWEELADPRTAERSLEALADVARVVRVRLQVSSRPIATTLTGRFSEWLETHADLTPLRESYRLTQPTAGRDAGEGVPPEAADAILDELSGGSGKARIIKELEDGARSVSSLKMDPEVTDSDCLSESSIDVYLWDLEGEDVVEVDHDNTASNSVALTPIGEVVAENIDPISYAVRDPLQATLVSGLTAAPQRGRKYSVPSAARSGGGIPQGVTPDGWLADTGDPESADGSFVQWLRPLNECITDWVMQKRITARARSRGVNLVDARISKWDDGRVSYASARGDDNELVVTLEFNGSLVSLGRMTATLLNNSVISKTLGPEEIGEEFEKVHGGAEVWTEWKEALYDVFRFGQQMGWFSEDEEDWKGWYMRYTSVKNFCLEELAKVAGGYDQERRSELFRKLHGLMMSTTQLLYAAGVDQVYELRIPDVQNMLREEKDYLLGDFLNFLKETVPRHGAYRSETGIHSWWRQTCEHREEKLKMRNPVGFDEDDPFAEPTVSWVITGPSITDLKDEIEAAIQEGVEDRLRDRVAEGVEQMPAMEIPVVNAGRFSGIKSVVRERAAGKHYSLTEPDTMMARQVGSDVDRLTRLFIRCLATEDRPRQCDPADVALAILSLRQSKRAADYLTVRDVESALAALPETTLFPDVLPSVTAIFQAVLSAKEPVGRSDILEESGKSEASYDRHIYQEEHLKAARAGDYDAEYGADWADRGLLEFALLGLLDDCRVDGHRKFEASIEPLWEEVGSSSLSSSLTTSRTHGDVLYELAVGLGVDVDSELWVWPRDLEAIYRASEELRRWRAYLMGIFDPPRDQRDSPPPSTVLAGRLPPAFDELQQDLASSATVSKSASISTPKSASYRNHSPRISTDGGGEGS